MTSVISISNGLHEIEGNVRLSRALAGFYYTVGVHPHNAKSITRLSQLGVLREVLTDAKCVAVGECGLDYNRMFSPREKQVEVFQEQVRIAQSLGSRCTCTAATRLRTSTTC